MLPSVGRIDPLLLPYFPKRGGGGSFCRLQRPSNSDLCNSSRHRQMSFIVKKNFFRISSTCDFFSRVVSPTRAICQSTGKNKVTPHHVQYNCLKVQHVNV